MLNRHSEEKSMMLPENLCSSTGELFRNPVICSDGITREQGEPLPDGVTVITKDKKKMRDIKKYLEKVNKDTPVLSFPDENGKMSDDPVVDALNKKDKRMIHDILSQNKNMLSEEAVFKYLTDPAREEDGDIAFYLLEMAQIQSDPSDWNGFFEKYIAAGGNPFLISAAIDREFLRVDDTCYAGENTLLHVAALHGHEDLIRRLIIHCDACIIIPNEAGKTAKDILVKNKQYKLAQMIDESLQEKCFIKQSAPLLKEIGILKRTLECQLISEATEKYEIIMMAHNDLVETAFQAGIFAVPVGHSVVSVPESHSRNVGLDFTQSVSRCSVSSSTTWNGYSLELSGGIDTYATTSSGNYKPMYYLKTTPVWKEGLSKVEENLKYEKCKIKSVKNPSRAAWYPFYESLEEIVSSHNKLADVMANRGIFSVPEGRRVVSCDAGTEINIRQYSATCRDTMNCDDCDSYATSTLPSIGYNPAYYIQTDILFKERSLVGEQKMYDEFSIRSGKKDVENIKMTAIFGEHEIPDEISEAHQKFVDCHNAFVDMLGMTGFFSARGRVVFKAGAHAQDTNLKIVQHQARCPYEPNTSKNNSCAKLTGDTDTYLANVSGPIFKPAFFTQTDPYQTSGCSLEDENARYNKCLLNRQ